MFNRRDIEHRIRKTAEYFGYQEICTPTFEHAELFIKKSGLEIVEQLYTFRDKGDRELVLRPELTAPAIRFYANDLYNLPKPLKIFYLGNCFRYERPQKGRFREFWQFGAELIGTDNPEGIAELIKLACNCLTNAGLNSYVLRVGDLNILKSILKDWEIFGETQKKFLTALDKGDIDSVRIILEDTGRSPDDVDAFFALIQAKKSSIEFNQRADQLVNLFPDIEQYLTRLKDVIRFLRLFGISEFNIDLGIARGLDYYIGIVFEIDVETLGAEKQVCGGGEYSLEELFDLKNIACSGFAIGFDRVVLAVELQGVSKAEYDLDIFIIPLSKEGLEKTIELAQPLRDAGYKVDFDIKGRNISKNLKYANGKNAKYALFIGEDELAKNSGLLREMESGEQKDVKFDELVEFFQKMI